MGALGNVGFFINYNIDVLYLESFLKFWDKLPGGRDKLLAGIIPTGQPWYPIVTARQCILHVISQAQRIGLDFDATPAYDPETPAEWKKMFDFLRDNCVNLKEILVFKHEGDEIEYDELVEITKFEENAKFSTWALIEAIRQVRSMSARKTETDGTRRWKDQTPWLRFMRVEKKREH